MRRITTFMGKYRFCSNIIRKYTNEHEWVLLNKSNNTAKVGITDYAQRELGELVYVQLPKIGLQFQKAGVVGAIESVKVAADIYAPVGGTVLHINDELNTNPGIINEDAENNWIFEASVSQPQEVETLMDKQQYEDFLNGLAK